MSTKDSVRLKAKNALLKLMARAARLWLKQSVTGFGKRFAWERLCCTYLLWRELGFIAKTRFGFRVRARINEFQEGRLFFFGFWEPSVTSQFRRLLAEGDVLIDVGANLGYFTLLGSRRVGPGGHVFAVEPGHRNRGRLEGNIALNAFDNVSVLPCGAWNEPGEATLQTGASGSGTATLGEITEDVIREERVELAALDDLIPSEMDARVRLIKIDAEGAEYRAVEGMKRILANAPRLCVICEINPAQCRKLGGSAEELFRLLGEFGLVPSVRIGNDVSPAAFFNPAWDATEPIAEAPTESAYVLFVKEEPKGSD